MSFKKADGSQQLDYSKTHVNLQIEDVPAGQPPEYKFDVILASFLLLSMEIVKPAELRLLEFVSLSDLKL